MRLNLGCGTEQLAGYVNIDLREDVHPDVEADATDLAGVGGGTVEEVRAFDLLEHFPASRTAAILQEWRRVLIPGGMLVVKVPNLADIAVLLANLAQVNDWRNDRVTCRLIENIYGGHRWGPDGAWDTHHTGWTPSTLAAALDEAGFEVVRNDLELNMTVEARKR